MYVYKSEIFVFDPIPIILSLYLGILCHLISKTLLLAFSSEKNVSIAFLSPLYLNGIKTYIDTIIYIMALSKNIIKLIFRV